MTVFFFAGLSGTDTSPTITFKSDDPHVVSEVFQITFSSTGTASLQGRVDASLPWVEIGSFTQSAIKEVVLAPQMRVVVTDNAGVINAAITGVEA